MTMPVITFPSIPIALQDLCKAILSDFWAIHQSIPAVPISLHPPALCTIQIEALTSPPPGIPQAFDHFNLARGGEFHP